MDCLCLLRGQDNDLSLVNGVGVHKTVGVALEDGLVLHQTGICRYSGTNTKKREDFNRMIDDCEAGNIDMIITKSISRFARNTLDCLKYIRELKDINIPVIFEKESIAHTTQKS